MKANQELGSCLSELMNNRRPEQSTIDACYRLTDPLENHRYKRSWKQFAEFMGMTPEELSTFIKTNCDVDHKSGIAISILAEARLEG